MSCEEALALMSAALDEPLEESEARALEAHLEECPSCKTLMETLRGLDEKTAALAEPAPEGLKRGVLYRIDQATGKAKAPRRRWFGPGAALGAVAAVLVLLVGTGLIPLHMPDKANSAAAPETEAPAYTQTQKSASALHGSSPQVETEAPEDNFSFYAAALPEAIEPSLSLEERKDTAYSAVTAASEPLEIPAEPNADSYYLSGGSQGSEARPVDEATRSACAARSVEADAAVLLYTEFSPETLFPLLQAEAPALYELVAELEPQEAEGLRCYETDCGTVLAIQEWLLENLPQSEEIDEAVREAETRLMIRMEELDPGSGSLYRVLSWSPRRAPVRWPETWPEGWALRLRSVENWALFFPTEDYSPQPDKPALLIFPAE